MKDDKHLTRVKVYVDGSCREGNPLSAGGYACILSVTTQHHGEVTSEFREAVVGDIGSTNITNNRMEIKAVIFALGKLAHPCKVNLFCDSEYVINCAQGKWKRNSNKDLWDLYDAAAKTHQIYWTWVKGHAHDELNIRVDQLAKEAMRIAFDSGRGFSETVTDHQVPKGRKPVPVRLPI